MAQAWDWLGGVPPVALAALAGLFTWALTAVGALAIFTRRQLSAALLDGMLGFAAGVMLAASVWSLLAPAMHLAESEHGATAWSPVAGFILGTLFLRVADRLLPHLHHDPPGDHAEGIRTAWRRSTLLLVAITLHNIPEGLALGVAFGGAALEEGIAGGATLSAALALTLGLGLHNIPEGVVVAMPLRREGIRPLRCFWSAQLSAAVEPAAAALGAAAVLAVSAILPYALSFAAGAMMYVVFEELLPEARRCGHAVTATIASAVGFAFMTALDLWLG